MSDSFDSNPYQAPGGGAPNYAEETTIRPQVVLWQIVYCAVMVLLFLATMAAGLVLLVKSELLANSASELLEFRLLGTLYAIMGAAVSVSHFLGIFWRTGKGGWTYNMVLICLGLSSCASWPATIPLLLFWLKHKDRIIDAPWVGEG